MIRKMNSGKGSDLMDPLLDENTRLLPDSIGVAGAGICLKVVAWRLADPMDTRKSAMCGAICARKPLKRYPTQETDARQIPQTVHTRMGVA